MLQLNQREPILHAYQLMSHPVSTIPIEMDILAAQLFISATEIATDAMPSGVITGDPVSDIRRVATLMHEFKLHGVPIVDQQVALLGIVTRSDILRAVTNVPPLNLWS